MDESVNQADEPDVEVEEVEVIEEMIIGRQMEGLGSKSVLSAPSTNTRLHVNYSVAWSWHSENIARHAPYHGTHQGPRCGRFRRAMWGPRFSEE